MINDNQILKNIFFKKIEKEFHFNSKLFYFINFIEILFNLKILK